jgi:hypothetical protein
MPVLGGARERRSHSLACSRASSCVTNLRVPIRSILRSGTTGSCPSLLAVPTEPSTTVCDTIPPSPVPFTCRSRVCPGNVLEQQVSARCASSGAASARHETRIVADGRGSKVFRDETRIVADGRGSKVFRHETWIVADGRGSEVFRHETWIVADAADPKCFITRRGFSRTAADPEHFTTTLRVLCMIVTAAR